MKAEYAKDNTDARDGSELNNEQGRGSDVAPSEQVRYEGLGNEVYPPAVEAILYEGVEPKQAKPTPYNDLLKQLQSDEG